MQVEILSPIKMRIIFDNDNERELTEKALTYKNKSIEYQIKQLKHKGYRFMSASLAERIENLSSQLYRCLLLADNEGYYTYCGLLPLLQKKFNVRVIKNHIVYPEFKLMPWHNMPKFSPHYAQQRALQALLNNHHAHIEMATGTGKSFLIMLLIKNAGLPTVVSTPNVSIAEQLFKQACDLFGKHKVGFFGDGKKQLGQDILIAVGKSLGLVKEKGLKEEFKKYQVLISDESHTLPAETFEAFCHDLLAHCPYRWFVSGTQQRTAGDDLLLEAIIGKRVYSYNIQQAIDDGVLAKLRFKIIDVKSESSYFNEKNIVKMNQQHFYKNRTIARAIAAMARKAFEENKPTLILIDEYSQEELLREFMTVEYSFANAQSDVTDIVTKFNEGKIMCVVGTSAVSVGTDFKPVQLTINWQANRSPIKIKQGAIGRSTRVDLQTGKKSCDVVDFRLINVPILKRHCDIRISYYREIGEIEYFSLVE